ncbi:hypothetical protein G6R29_02520 [Fructobacillus sp. M2-14]|uniref:Uncharacterized protein n=1 Tax=Fructobacillus broussonetiae TaxID=2713173 RepID=A0ABS5QZ97_9LACO|nr:hypothetical protein [Fructobacillus broussonetiae]MBS9338511.1 hypothetical protein [Fructobacillus broussonetiae]
MTPQQITNQNRYASFFLLFGTLFYFTGIDKLTGHYIVPLVLLAVFFGVRRPVIFYYFFKRLYMSFQYEVRHVEKYADWKKRGAFRFTWFAPYALSVSLIFQVCTLNAYFLPLVAATAGLFFYQKKKGRLPESSDNEDEDDTVGAAQG